MTVGTQLPFPRLVDAMNAIAADLSERIVAQVGPAENVWPDLDVRKHLAPDAFETLFEEARVVVAHAGIGSILTARRRARPLVILPRRAALGEHRNDHQIATAQAVGDMPGIYVAWEAEALLPLLARDDLAAGSESETPSPARQALISRLSSFISESGPS